MFSKYLKLFGGDKPVDSEAKEGPPSIIGEMLPLMDKTHPPGRVIGHAVDTEDAQATVTDVLPVETYGKRTQLTDLLQRFLGHQPILDASGKLFGYELSLRKAAPGPGASAETLQQMHDEMLLASLVDLDVQHLRGNKLIFAAISPATLDSGFLQRIPGEGIVLALPAREVGHEALATHGPVLRKLGYRIALDDPSTPAALESLLRHADFVRINAKALDAMKLGELALVILKQGHAMPVATHVDADEIHDVTHKLGFKLFQGYSFTHLQPGHSTKLDAQRMHVMELLNMAVNKAEIADIERMFKRDPALSYRLLRYINSAANGLLQPVRSLNHALMVLGYGQLYRWLTMLLLSSGKPDFRTLALMKTALVRGHLMELLGKAHLPPIYRDGLFIVGVFSLLDALLNLPMTEAIATLKLQPEITQALLERQGIYAPYLELVLACEDQEDMLIETYAAACGINAEELNTAQAQSLRWAEDIHDA